MTGAGPLSPAGWSRSNPTRKREIPPENASFERIEEVWIFWDLRRWLTSFDGHALARMPASAFEVADTLSKFHPVSRLVCFETSRQSALQFPNSVLTLMGRYRVSGTGGKATQLTIPNGNEGTRGLAGAASEGGRDVLYSRTAAFERDYDGIRYVDSWEAFVCQKICSKHGCFVLSGLLDVCLDDASPWRKSPA